MTAAVDTRQELLASIVRGVGRASSHNAALTHALAVQLGVGPTDLDCLTLLHELGPASAGQLAEVLSLTTGAITGVIDRLAAAGFVVRDSDPADRRRVIVRTVPERLDELDRAYAPVLDAAARSLWAYTDAELRLVLDFQQRAAQLLLRETERLKREQSPFTAGADLEAPLGELIAGSLEFSNGASELRIYASDRTAMLFHAAFDGTQPSVKLQDGKVTLRYARMNPLEWGKHAGTVGLNPTIPWSIALRGGASRVVVDARRLSLKQLSVGGGANQLEVYLPEPIGTVPVCVEGGLSRVQMRHPEAAPVQLRIHGGANRLEFDGQRFGAVGGDARLASPGWELATDRYDVELCGGASRLEIVPIQEV